MAFPDRGLNGGWQADGQEGSSPSKSNGVPASLPNYPNDPSLTGSSSHGPRPQESGPTTPLHTQNLIYNQYGYFNYPTSQSDPTSSNQSPRVQNVLTQAWPNGQPTDTQIATVGMYYPPQYTPGDTSGGNTHHTLRTSPFYPVEPPNSRMVQPISHQQVIQDSGNRRPSFPQLYAPTPQQSTDYSSVPSPSRSSSSYSHPGTSPQRFRQQVPLPPPQWPPSLGQSSRSTSNSTSATNPHNDAGSHSPAYPLDVVLSGNSTQASHPTSLAQLPPYLGEMSSYTPYVQSDGPNDGPQFPVPQPFHHPAQVEERGVKRGRSYPQSDRQTRKKSRPDEPPVASSSRVTLDPPPPRAARGGCGRDGKPQQTPAQEKDAKRKKGERDTKKGLSNRIARLLPPPQGGPDTLLNRLTRVIEHLGGTPPEHVNYPRVNPQKKRSEKSHANGVRAHNEERAYSVIRELLTKRGYNISQTVSQLNLLQIVTYMLSNEDGVEDQELAKLIRKFFNPPDGGTR